MSDIQKTIKMFKKVSKLVIDALETEDKKRPREEEVSEVEKKEVPVKAKSEEWVCSGRVWETPAADCDKGIKSDIKDGMLYDGKRYIVCRACKNARTRDKKKAKKDAPTEAE